MHQFTILIIFRLLLLDYWDWLVVHLLCLILLLVLHLLWLLLHVLRVILLLLRYIRRQWLMINICIGRRELNFLRLRHFLLFFLLLLHYQRLWLMLYYFDTILRQQDSFLQLRLDYLPHLTLFKLLLLFKYRSICHLGRCRLLSYPNVLLFYKTT